MSGITLEEGQEFIYRVDIYKVFEFQSYSDKWDGRPRVRLEEPKLIQTAYYGSARAARSYGSMYSGRGDWYNTLGKKPYWSYAERKYITPEMPNEPDMDYKVYKIRVNLEMGNAIEIPPLKKLAD